MKFIYFIKELFKKIFKNNKVMLLEESNTSENIESNINVELAKEQVLDNKVENKEIDKKRVFDLYKRVKKNEIDLDLIDLEDLIKIRELLREELKLYIKKNEENRNEVNILRTEVNNMSNKLSGLLTETI